jgi:hypothetical protein
MSQKSFIPKNFGMMGGHPDMQPPVRNIKHSKYDYNENSMHEHILLLSEKISLMNMKIDNHHVELEKMLREVLNKTKILSEKVEEISAVINDGSSISTMNHNEEYSENNSDINSDYDKDNSLCDDCCNKNNKSTTEKKKKEISKCVKEEKKLQKSGFLEDNGSQKPKGIIVKFNGKGNTPFNPLDFLMNLTQSMKQKEEPKEIDSDDDYDDKFQIYDNTDEINIDKDYIDINDKFESINDIIRMGEKYGDLVEKSKLKKEDKKKDKKKYKLKNDTSDDSDSDLDSHDVFDVFNIEADKKENDDGKEINTENKFCKFYTLEGKKYNINLQTVCNLTQPLKKLNRIIGMKNVKEQIFEMIIYYLQGFENENKNMLHSVIEGPPGVGKTKLGKIMAQIYCALGIIPSNKFKYIKATDMIGDHVGATKHMTQSVIDEADGGVLFIDEAYALSTSETKDPYGKECMDTLNFNLSENKKKLIVIIAGYPDQLERCFFSHNPGLQRRFPFRYKVEKYTPKELSEIFQDKLKRYKWKINKEITDDYLEKFFKKNLDDFKNFGGDIENFFKKCQFSHSKRTIGLHPEYRGKLSIEDMDNGLKTFKQNKKKEDDTYKQMFI